MIRTLRLLYHNLVPASLQATVLALRRAPIWRARGVIFIHIPRTGGTGINHALYGRFVGHIPMATVIRSVPADVLRLPSFAVARNPWARLVSAYRFACRGSGVQGPTAAIANPHLYRGSQFRSFEAFVREWLVHQDVESLDGVFRPQAPYVFDRAGRLLVDHLGRLEDLEPTRQFLAEALATVPDFAPANLSGPALDYRDLYDSGLRDTVGHLYRRDVELLGYDFDEG